MPNQYTNGIMPKFGVVVPPGDAVNTTDALIKNGLQPTFFADGCRFYVEAASVNGIISEILNAVNCMGLEYDPDRLDNLCLAIKAAVNGDAIAVAICNSQQAQNNIAQCLSAEIVSSICQNHDNSKDALVGCLISGDGNNQLQVGSDGAMYVPPMNTNINEATTWILRVGIGQVYMVDVGMGPGVEIPPVNYDNDYPVFIKLSDGNDGYNLGKLDTYATSGSAGSPEYISTARIAVPGPLFGRYVHLLNSEQSILRPRPDNVSGNLQFDQMQGHAHQCGPGSGVLLLPGDPGSGFYNLVTGGEQLPFTLLNAGANCLPSELSYGVPRVGAETRSKNVGVVAYMRVR